MEVKNKIIQTIKDIHNKKKRADLDNISAGTKDMDLEGIKLVLEELCNENILNLATTRSGYESYRFCSGDIIEQYEDSTSQNGKENIGNNDNNNGIQDIINWNLTTPENILLKEDIQSSERFQALNEYMKSIIDLKEFISYEVNKLEKNKVNDIIIQIKEENSFLKNEIRELREIIKNMVENITRPTQSTETLLQATNVNNKSDNSWSHVSKGSLKSQPHYNSDIVCSNRFNGLTHEINYNDYDDNNVETSNLHMISKENIETRKRRPNPVINLHPEREKEFSNIKASNENNHHNNKKIRILCDSIPKGIRIKEFNRYIKYGYARIKSFPGTTINQLNNYYSIPTLKEEKPEIVILHVGINDLLSNRENNTPEDKIAEEIINIGRKCKDHGVETVFISGITFCKNVDRLVIVRVNQMIKIESEKNGFVYIDNKEINGEHIWKDGIHLQENGKIILANNFIDHINNFLDQKLVLPNQT